MMSSVATEANASSTYRFEDVLMARRTKGVERIAPQRVVPVERGQSNRQASTSRHVELSRAEQQSWRRFSAIGVRKRSVVGRAKAGDRTLPAAQIEPIGRIHWLIDRYAASA
jgi:hypothetical protein